MDDQKDSDVDEEEVDRLFRPNAVLDSIRRYFGHDKTLNWDESDVYSCEHKFRGTALIVNNDAFRTTDDAKSSVREGSSLDAAQLENVFKKHQFHVERHDNLTSSEMVALFHKVVKYKQHVDSDCFVCVLLSHGNARYRITGSAKSKEDVVFGTDMGLFTCAILELFADDNCPGLKNKPKLFFFQACRGTNLDPGQTVATSIGEDETDAIPVEDDLLEITPAPCFKDFLVMYATPPGYYAFRRPDTGSWFIQALCSVLDEYSPKDDLLKTLTRVAKMMLTRESSSVTDPSISGKKQSPCMISMLMRDFYLTPKA